MKLRSTDGTEFSLTIDGYQFQESDVDHPADLDWLVVTGSLTRPGKPDFRFTEPCLTTFEARHLGEWLARCVGSPAAPAPLTFAEPCLAFAMMVRGDDVDVKIRLAAEAQPPVDMECPGGVVRLKISTSDLLEAAAQWDADVTHLPSRRPWS